MTKKQYLLMILLALVTGLIGGALSSHIIQPVFAEKTQKLHEKIIRAGGIELVDEKGKIYAKLTQHKGRPELYLRDSKGAVVTLFIDRPGGEPRARAGLFLMNENGDNIKLIASDVPYISFSKDNYNYYARLSRMGLTIEENNYRLHVFANQFFMRGPGGEVEIETVLPGPHVSLKQKKQIQSTLGCIDLVTKKTGTKITRSAASLVLFDEKGSVIWSTPE